MKMGNIRVTVLVIGGVPLCAASIRLALIGIQYNPSSSTITTAPAMAHFTTSPPSGAYSSCQSATRVPSGDKLLQKRTKMAGKASAAGTKKYIMCKTCRKRRGRLKNVASATPLFCHWH